MTEVPSVWVDVADANTVATLPLAVTAGDTAVVLLRERDGGAVRAYLDRCPHRLVPLSAASRDGDVLRCPYHGWEFGVDGACVALPSLGDGTRPPRADLTPVGVRETDGRIEVAVPPAQPAGAELTNVDPALARAWHPVALSSEVGATPLQVRLLGESWQLRRDGDVICAAGGGNAPYGVAERWGLVFLAPAEPVIELFEDPDDEDAAYAGAWLPPSRTAVPAGVVADNFLDVAHFPFVHAGTFGADEENVVPAYDVTAEHFGCRSVQVQWFDNPGDPGVVAGQRPLRQRRRATYVHRAPFQLMLRLEELDAGAVKTILFFAQPEDLRSTRIYTKMLLHGIGGVPEPDAATVAAEVAFEEAVLAEDLTLQALIVQTALPLDMRAELHVRADRLGVALRRALSAFVTVAMSQNLAS